MQCKTRSTAKEADFDSVNVHYETFRNTAKKALIQSIHVILHYKSVDKVTFCNPWLSPQQVAMQAFRFSLFGVISLGTWLVAYSQKCDIVLYSAPCGKWSFYTR